MEPNPNLNTGSVARVYAGVGGLMAFVVAIVAGLEAQNAASQILFTALLCMAGCYLLGSLLGAIAEHGVRAHIKQYRDNHPIPEPAPAVVGDAVEAA